MEWPIDPNTSEFRREITSDSLVADHILEGDIVIADRGRKPGTGDIVAIRTGDDSRAEIQKLKAALTSAEVKKFIETEYKGAVVPAF